MKRNLVLILAAAKFLVSIAKETLDSLRKQVLEEQTAVSGATANPAFAKGDSIQLSQKMKVVMTVAGDNFNVIDSPQSSEQDFEGTTKLDWEWLIEPTTVTNQTIVEFRIYAFNLNGNGQWVQVNHPVKSFNIKVQIDPQTLWDRAVTFLDSDQKFLWGSIIIPVVAFFGGRFSRRKK